MIPSSKYRFIFFSILILSCLLCSNSAFAGKTRTPGTQRPYVIKNHTYYPLPTASGYVESGIASWYGRDFHGRLTSNGEKYNMHDITAAHKLLPMHTMLLVQNKENGKKIVVRVNDRGPFIQGRIIDLSYGAAKKLGLVNSGTARVTITALGEVQNKKSGENIVFKAQADLRSGEYYVQIGAFLQKYNALELQDKFSKANHKAIIRKAQVNGKLFYRVHVYVGRTLNNARRSEKALLSKGYRGAFIIAL